MVQTKKTKQPSTVKKKPCQKYGGKSILFFQNSGAANTYAANRPGYHGKHCSECSGYHIFDKRGEPV